MDLGAFAKIAPYLSHPLTLVGFVLLLFFGVHRGLVKSGIIPPVARTHAPQIVKMLLTYGFVVALVVIGGGFALQAYQSYMAADAGPDVIEQQTSGTGSPAVADTKGDVTITIEQPPAATGSSP